ncbi:MULTISPECIES: hypothetical protein [unclassified Carboxylicivirga]|uniref:hypothetical protein n=1 Tax=Carboxylicivirga TaxID=1628153 RepID=UPI003D32F41F
MKRFSHYFFGLLVALLLSLVLVAELAENKVTQMALIRVNEAIDAHITVGEVDFSLVKKFPDAMVELSHVAISNDEDTLAVVDRVFVSAAMLPLIKGEFSITQVAVEGGNAYYMVDSAGRSNFDVFMSEEIVEPVADTSETVLSMSMENVELNNLFCTYWDEQQAMGACLYVDKGIISLLLDAENTKAGFTGRVRANNCRYPQTTLHLMEETVVEADVHYENGLLNLHHVQLQSDGIAMSLQGKLKSDSALWADVQLEAAQIDMGILQKYVPGEMLREYGLQSLGGVGALVLNVKGLYTDSVMPHIEARFKLKDGQLTAAKLPVLNTVQLTGTYSNGDKQNNSTTQIKIDTLYLASGNSSLSASGQLSNLDHISYALQTEGLLDLSLVAPMVPDSIVNNMSGQVRMQLATTGVMPDSFGIDFADYVLSRTYAQLQLNNVSVMTDSLVNLLKLNGEISYQPQRLKVDDLRFSLPDYKWELKKADLLVKFSGQLCNMSSLGLDVEGLDVQSNKSSLKGQLHFNNPNHPSYDIDAAATIDLAEMKPFAPDSLISDMSGVIHAGLRSAGSLHLDSLADDLMELLFTSSRMTGDFDDVHIDTHDELMQLHGLSGNITLANDSIEINQVEGELAGMTFDADSSLIRNFYKAYWLNQPDTVKADVYFNFGDIDYVALAPLVAGETAVEEDTDEQEAVAVPTNYRFAAKGKVRAKSFWYDNALLENMSALFNVSDSLYVLDQVKFDAFKGTMNSSVKVEMLPNDEMKINLKNTTHGLDVNQLLYDFDDFMDYSDEVYISNEQLSGILSTDSLHAQVIFVGDSLDLNQFKLTAKIKLEDGRIKDYPMTSEMADDYNFPELKDLQFKTLDTKIFTHDGAVYVPLTDIKTNAFDIAILGRQEFNMDCQYHLRFYLKEILRRGKTDRIEKKQASEDTKRGGGVKGLASMFAIYKVKDGKTEKSFLEGKDSDAKKKLRSQIYLKEAMAKLEFHPLIVTYETDVNDKK